MLHQAVVRRDAPQCLTKMLPKPVRSREKSLLSFFALLLMRKLLRIVEKIDEKEIDEKVVQF